MELKDPVFKHRLQYSRGSLHTKRMAIWGTMSGVPLALPCKSHEYQCSLSVASHGERRHPNVEERKLHEEVPPPKPPRSKLFSS
ncbi:hypothetical protein Mapa_009884 [Marchantia paleacea]|nr:hypothetical protein Mapa_009884 [Marchantia paleacea]